MGIRPLQLDVTEGVSNNTTVLTLGKAEDLIASAGANGVFALTADEVTQLAAIGTTTISAGQWVYLGAMNQGIATTDSPTFAELNVDNVRINGNTISTTNADGSLTIDCNGAGIVDIPRAGTFGAVTAATQIYVGNIDIAGDVITSSANVDLKSSLSTGNVRILDDSDVPVFCYCNDTDIFAFSDTVTISVGNDLKVNTINTYNAITGVTIEDVQLNNRGIKVDTITELTAADGVGIENLNITTNTISSTNTNEDIKIIPEGTGVIYLGDGNVTTATNASLVLDGQANTRGAHIECYTSADSTYPTSQFLNWGHDNVGINFDSYLNFGGGAWISCDVGSNYQIYKTSDELKINYDSGISLGSNITWNTGLKLDTTGLVTIPTAFKAGNVTISDSKISTSAGALTLNSVNNMVIIGDGAAGVDMVLFFNGQSNDGQIKWWEDEAYFDFDHYIEQPGLFAEIYVADASTAQSIATGVTYTKSTAFTSNGQSANCTSDATNDKITITQTGKYRVSGSCSATAGKANLTWRGAAFLNNVEQDQVHWKRKMTTTTDSGDMSFTGFIDVTSVPWDLDFRLRHDDGGNQNFTIEYANLNVEYIGAT